MIGKNGEGFSRHWKTARWNQLFSLMTSVETQAHSENKAAGAACRFAFPCQGGIHEGEGSWEGIESGCAAPATSVKIIRLFMTPPPWHL
jgi:hypothetical protein